MTARSGDSDLANGGCIAYASKDDLKFTFAVKRNYEIADIKVNYAGEDVFSLAEDSGEGKLAETADSESGTEIHIYVECSGRWIYRGCDSKCHIQKDRTIREG